MARPSLTQTPIEALSGPVETTSDALIQEFGWQGLDLLDAVSELSVRLNAWGIQSNPPLNIGGLTTSRVLSPPTATNPLTLVTSEAAGGEGPTLEFKETLLLDVDKMVKGKQPLESCRSEDVLHSTLKTIAAFLNTTGGTMLLGVTDGGELTDLCREFPLTCPKGKETFDHWELFLRRRVEQWFVDGRSLLPSITVQRVEHDDGTVARIMVGARSGLSVMKVEGKEVLYIRSGNETLSVKISELPQFFMLGKKFV